MEQSEDEDNASLAGLSEQQLSPGVLPMSIAKKISLAASTSTMCLRLGTFVGEIALDTARVGTLTTLELVRAAAEKVLSQAGRDITNRSVGSIGRADCESLLGRSVAALHSTITHVSFAASTGFFMSSMALSSVSEASQKLLTAIDSVFGSTDSSRAIASIVLLTRREFANPATGMPGETVGLHDLVTGICGLALLQRWCRRLNDLEATRQSVEQVVWDVIILDDGRRADVTRSTADKDNDGQSERSVNTFQTLSAKGEILHTQDDDVDNAAEKWPDDVLKAQILRSLSSNAQVRIITETMSTKTITVEVTGAHIGDVTPPPGLKILRETISDEPLLDSVQGELTAEERLARLAPRHRIVYQMLRKKSEHTTIDTQDETSWSVEGAARTMTNKRGKTHTCETALMISDDASQNDIETASSKYDSSSVPAASVTIYNDVGDNIISQAFLPHRTQNASSSNLSTPQHVAAMSDSATRDSLIDEGPNSANQKRSRKPATACSNLVMSPTPRMAKDDSTPSKRVKSHRLEEAPQRQGIVPFPKDAKAPSTNIWTRNITSLKPSNKNATKKSQDTKPKWNAFRRSPETAKISDRSPTQATSTVLSPRDTANRTISSPQCEHQGHYMAGRDSPALDHSAKDHPPLQHDEASFHNLLKQGSFQQSRRSSVVSQIDVLSMHSIDVSSELRESSNVETRSCRTHAYRSIEDNLQQSGASSGCPRFHRRSSSIASSIQTMSTSTCAAEIVLACSKIGGLYDQQDALNRLSSTGYLEGLFPRHHIVRNIARFARFASASYGSHFMRVMGMTQSTDQPLLKSSEDHHHEHYSFSNHTQMPASTILLSSFHDPQGGTNSSGETETGIPMVHFISLDHESKSVVLTCRGTLGFEDILTDMTCDYDDLELNGFVYKVHKGIHASAMRMLSGKGSRVIATLAKALEDHPEYGLVMCGHSLGGSVVALLAIMVSEPDPLHNTAFITSSRSASRISQTQSSNDPPFNSPHCCIPAGRPIHVYAYGPPATLSPSLRLKTRGLITTIINGQDLVPFLSLGVLHDLQAIALAFKTDDTNAKGEVRSRVWAGLTSSFVNKWYGEKHDPNATEDDEWSYAALKTLRASMLHEKLVPPGECFVVERTPVLQRDMFVQHYGEDSGLGKPATRVVLTYVRDVEKRFGELRFGGSMLLDHSPGRYETNLAVLAKGVVG